MTVLGSTVAAGAIFGSVFTSGGPVALAANAQQQVPAAPSAKPAAAPAKPALSAAVVPAPVAATPTATPTPAKPMVAAAPPAPTQAPKAPVVHKQPTQAPAPPADNQYSGQSAYQIAQQLVPSGQFGCFDWIVTRESGWDVTATNPSSGAYGLGQALPGDKMASAGPDWQTDATTQIEWALNYMNTTYGSPNQAWVFWQANNWY